MSEMSSAGPIVDRS